MRILALFSFFLVLNGCFELPENIEFEQLRSDDSIIDDDSNSPEKHYLSKSNLPWAINLPVSINYPKENNAISQAYLKFRTWAENGGFELKDWYEDRSNYRNYSKIY